MGAAKGNKNALGNNGGKPPFYKTPEELQMRVDEYFKSGAEKRKIISGEKEIEIPVYTITGLALFLGFSTRKSLLDYEEKLEFVNIIKKAKTKVEMYYEQNLHFNNATGSIFALKNMGWQDKTEIDQKNTHEFTSLPEINIKRRK